MTFVGLTLLMAIAFTQSSTILPPAMESDGLKPSAYDFVTAFAGTLERWIAELREVELIESVPTADHG